ncbi:MAG: hypothetical protein WBW93_18095 [Steroidobacteraceae bacterium]
MTSDPIGVAGRYSVRATTPEDGPEIVALMADAGLRPNVEPQDLHWKYWQERRDWSGSRSYVLCDGGAIVAHAAVIPLSCEVEGRHIRVVYLIDWAARVGEPGTGVMLLRRLAALGDALIGFGGSDATLKLLPVLGFRRCGSVTQYVRTLRPLKLLSDASQPRSWRLLPRLARSAVWCITAPRPDRDQWRARRVSVDQLHALAPFLSRSGGAVTAFERNEALLGYALSCPIVPMELFVLEHAGRARGYFILAFVSCQARLVDCWVDSDALADWCALIQCAVHQAGQRKAIAELATWGSDPMLSACLEECGFHPRSGVPILVRSGRSAGIATPTFRVQMLDSDAAYLYGEGRMLWA